MFKFWHLESEVGPLTLIGYHTPQVKEGRPHYHVFLQWVRLFRFAATYQDSGVRRYDPWPPQPDTTAVTRNIMVSFGPLFFMWSKNVYWHETTATR